MSATLGDYEMVMSLSQDTVNTLFRRLRKDHKIRNVWSSRITFSPRNKPIQTVIDENLPGNPTFAELDVAFTAGFEEASKNHEKQEHMEGFIAETGVPFISMKEGEPFKVNFNIPFEHGRLDRFFPGDSETEHLCLDGMVYVFTVELSKIAYRNDAENSKEIPDHVKTFIDAKRGASSLEPEDFTVERLFLNFETADFIAERAETIPPEGWTFDDIDEWKSFRDTLQGYFKTTAFESSDNPYVLGYGVVVPELEKLPAKPWFEPCALNFSTSFVSLPDTGKANGKRCSLNYLMMMTKMPAGGSRVGIMDSLLGAYDLLGIDYDLFFTRYLKRVFDAIADALKATVANLNKPDHIETEKSLGLKVSTETGTLQATSKISVSYGAKCMSVDFGTAKIYAEDRYYMEPTATSIGYLQWRYTKIIDAHPRAEIKFRGGILQIDLVFGEDTEYHMEQNAKPTSGKAKTKQYATGLHIDLKPGSHGTMVVDVAPYGEENKPIVTEWGKHQNETIESVDRAITGNFYSALRLPKFCSDLKEHLQADLKNLPQIVLPIGNVYAYKEVGFEENQSYGVITFHSTYSPEVKPAPAEG